MSIYKITQKDSDRISDVLGLGKMETGDYIIDKERYESWNLPPWNKGLICPEISQRNIENAKQGKHPAQTNKFKQMRRDMIAEEVKTGTHAFQRSEHREQIRKRMLDLSSEGIHPSQTQEARKKASERGKIKYTCPHCSKQGTGIVFKRWHFDRCKTIHL
jgi:hypothetical protein